MLVIAKGFRQEHGAGLADCVADRPTRNGWEALKNALRFLQRGREPQQKRGN